VAGTEGGHGERQNTVKNGKKGGGLAAPERASILMFDKEYIPKLCCSWSV